MRGVIVSALALALLPAAVMAQDPPPVQQQPPAQQQPAQPEQPAEPKLTFEAPAGLLLIQIKPDQTATFEDMVSKLKSGLATVEDASVRQATTGFKIYKSSDGMQGNALYVVVVDPATPKAEYDFFMLLQKTMTPDQLRDPATIDMFKQWSNAFAAPYNKLNLTPIGGM